MDIKVLVVDDSALVRKILTDIIQEAEGITCTATASDPLFAIQKMTRRFYFPSFLFLKNDGLV